uniref:Phosphofructokinase n=1 Tax=Dunaliella tertiolecta TaxID=3047 RepID=A0A088MME1_DUNTE|nr:phosphofructokinase [Dunaliella tertiolecta]
MLYRRAGAQSPALRDRSVVVPPAPRHAVIPHCKATETGSSKSAPAPPKPPKPGPVGASVPVTVGQAPDGKKVVSVTPPPQYTATPYTAGRVSSASLDEEEDVLPLRNLRKHLKPMDSPFVVDNNRGGGFVGDRDRVRLHTVEYESQESAGAFCADGIATFGDEDVCLVLPEWAIRCGPRKTIYADPTQVSAAVVTCGGLCPGLNDVIQNIVYTLRDYGVPEDNILGIKYGLRGFYERDEKPITLTSEMVDGVHLKGGTMLGTSRGGANIKEIVRRIDLWGLNMVFVIGGNGGNAAAHAIAEECEASGVVCSVVGVPKSIDNDILLVDRCFGFETAVEEAQRALLAAKVEASSAHHGIGLVKLMGRQSGFIAMQASMASGVVDVCLIPEIQFDLQKLNEYVAKVIERKGHCVVCLAEGAGQNVVKGASKGGTDASGNPILADIGPIVKDSLKDYLKGNCDIKYIDPTYMIRAIPTTTNDRVYCKVLGQGAVHGAFAGYTDITVGLVNTHYVYMPIQTIIQAPRRVNPTGRRWNRLVSAIGQPNFS